jgi:hypothetical protein
MIQVRNQIRDMLGGETGKITLGRIMCNLGLRAIELRFGTVLCGCGLQGYRYYVYDCVYHTEGCVMLLAGVTTISPL